MEGKQSMEPHDHCCDAIVTERNRYFTGKYMTARDFEDEQAYFRSRHQLHNRILHGWGVVCGLRVLPHPNKECASRWVVIRAGIAIDCCGRELVLRKDTAFELPPPPENSDEQQESNEPQHESEIKDTDNSKEERPNRPPKREEGPYLLCLRLKEEQIEFVPALYAEGCDPARKEANRIRECASLEVRLLDDVEPGCWKMAGGSMEGKCRDDCDEDLPAPAGPCLTPECPCGGCVPLALIAVDNGKVSNIDMLGRRTFPVPQDYLTHVSGINWTHGGEITISDLREKLKGRLEIRFDRKIQPADGDKTGIGPYTLVVEYGGIQQDIEYLPWKNEDPPSLEDDCMAVFTIDPEYLELGRDRKDISGNTVYVTLKCDFIMDCHGNPVDGAHLRGRLPSGNGTRGSMFQSWFRVVHDDYGRPPVDDRYSKPDRERERERDERADADVRRRR